MVKLIDKTRISTLDYLFMVFIIIYAARANAFVRGIGNPLSVGNALICAFTIIMFFNHRVKFTSNYLFSILVLVFYAILTFIAHNYVSMGFIPRWFIYLSVAYVLCQIYGARIFTVFETALLPLVIISMIMWVFHLLFPSLIHNFVETFSLPSFSTNPNYMTYNCIFYTINGDEDRILGDYYLFKRNAGFAWEPGAFACFGCLGIACQLIRNPNKLITPFVILYLAVIATSQSTTGVYILGAMLLTWIIINKKIWWAILLTPLILYVSGLSFVNEKFLSELADVTLAGGNLNAVEYHGRLFGLEASLVEFMLHPIIGLGGKMDTELEAAGLDAVIFSGIGDLLTRFGLILSVIFFVLVFKSEKFVRHCYDNKCGFLIVIIILLSMVSYSMWEQPLFLSFSFMCIYGPSRQLSTQRYFIGRSLVSQSLRDNSV